jgi:hypothetical protein
MLFNIFVASAAVMFILFVFLYFTVMRRLNVLYSKNSVGSKVIGRRYDRAQNEQKESGDVCAVPVYMITGYVTQHYSYCSSVRCGSEAVERYSKGEAHTRTGHEGPEGE